MHPTSNFHITSPPPPPFTHTHTQGNSLRVFLVRPEGFLSGAGFRATYTVEDAACGGELTSAQGRFASPSYPDSYPPSAQCVWTLGSAPGNRVGLSFLAFDLEDSQGCNKDYVEVHRDSAEGPLVGHFCGGEVPSNLTVGNTLWIKFNSDGDGTGGGFVAQYTLRA